MNNKKKVRSISFDTSFLLKNHANIDFIIKELSRDRIPCFLTITVLSELEQLKIWGRISQKEYTKAIIRWKKTHGNIIDFKNRLLSDLFTKECLLSMKKHHGVSEEDIHNDCSILISTLKGGVDVFLSEDFHFTSKITKEVIKEVTHAACHEYHQMCDSILYAINSDVFLKSYGNGYLSIKVVEESMQNIKKSGKRMQNTI